ncbi:SGNH/GDSL hydrolase family protein [Nannocystis bainbridge]|uniref:SGNH/GDSL hydrolase family protein n=1 Tax=Nannocystis bainbridge TaxID=2995303 RepID=A0ABT5DPX0_9BACT|nr:SGNH/GDSL hydrolase family protein [Nannocystis bainbridge]MDC0715643.1 SGNH/GDSL hydrolase family protein [Nannocystis bainbridge]
MAIHYVALGDSAGAGFGVPAGAGYVDRMYARLQQRDPAARLLNLARNGATAEALRAEQVNAAVLARPTVLSLFIGGNDLWRGVTPSHYGRNLEAIADRLDRARCPVVIGTLPNMSHAPAAALAERFLGIGRAQIEERIVAYNERVRRLAIDHSYALVDLFGAHRLDEHAEYFAADGFHPSAAGHAAWFETIWPTFAAVHSQP